MKGQDRSDRQIGRNDTPGSDQERQPHPGTALLAAARDGEEPEPPQALAANQEEEQYAREICLTWSNATAGMHTSLLKFLAQFPTLQQVQVFEAQDWNRLTQIQAMLRRVLDECERLGQESQGLVVDAEPGVSFAREKEQRYDRTANV